jgi:multidrug efflux system outer membrane protein
MVRPIVSRVDRATPPAARSYLDSLARVRAAESDSITPAALWRPRALTAASAGDLAWLDVLQDSQLVALVRTAVANNRDLATAQARIREFRAQHGVAQSALYPQLSANGSGGRFKVVQGDISQRYDAISVTANLSWELDFWGRLRRQGEAAAFDARGREEAARATMITLVSDVATVYLQLRQADENLRISEATRTSRLATLELARRRFAQQLISALDVRQFEAQVAEPAVNVARFTLERTRLENQLAVLLGQPPGPIARGGPLATTIQAVTVPDSLPGTLVARRPDVMRAQADWQAALARVGVAMANRLPAVTLTGSYGSQRPKFVGLFEPRGEIYTAQLGISLPLFTGGNLVNQQRAARARADEAKAQYEQTVLLALGEADDALAAVRLTHDQLVAQATQVEALRAAYTLAERRYASGISSYLEVLDAQRTLFAAELSFVQQQGQYLASTVQLYKALGGSWNAVSSR